MELDWDPEIDTPATVAVIGGGPLGVEAALYARFLGYFVMLFDQRKLGDSLLGWGHYPMPNASGTPASWREVTTPLGLAALEAQTGLEALPAPDEPVTYRQYVEKYLLPVARTDLLHESVHVHSPVLSVSRHGCSQSEACSLPRRGEQEFRLLINSKSRGEFSQLADVVLDCSGASLARRGLASGGGLAIGEQRWTEKMWLGKCDVLGRRREQFAGKQCLLFGNNLEACGNARDLLQLARDVPDTRLTWVLPKRIGAEGFQLTDSATPGWAQELVEGLRRALDEEPDALVPIAAWGIESLSLDDTRWSVKLQSTLEETVDVEAEVFINCADRRDDGSYRAELLVGSPGTTASTLTAEPHYFQLGQRALGGQRLCGLAEGFQQIVETFALVGGRQGLNLYTTVKPSR